MALQLGPVTAVLIGICAAVALLSRLGENNDVLDKLFISINPESKALPEVMHGEVWRLATPLFLHFGWIHLIFNMMWLKDLGSAIERVFGRTTLLLQVFGIGILSNLGEYFFSRPFFGGMSGVVYGMLGFLWMKSKFDPGCGLRLSKQTIVMMIAWFFICMTGALGDIANYAHGFGLALGMAWGYLAPKTVRQGM